ncbi:hypothetical protein D3C78_1729960 [compost metagenome]
MEIRALVQGYNDPIPAVCCHPSGLPVYHFATSILQLYGQRLTALLIPHIKDQMAEICCIKLRLIVVWQVLVRGLLECLRPDDYAIHTRVGRILGQHSPNARRIVCVR